MEISVISNSPASDLAMAATLAGCVVLAVIMFLSEDRRKPVLALFSHHVLAFMAPLLVVFAYLVIIWAAKILTR